MANVTLLNTDYADVPAIILPKTGGGSVRFIEEGGETLFIASYGHSTFQEILNAYKNNEIVYCRASSNSNPATGSQLRMAFLAYVGTSTDNPSSFEFQYYRSVNTHSDSQQGDQVFVYTITSAGAWSVVTRNAFTKIVAGTGLKSNWSNGVLTISLDT